jgi:hypothetical protein
LLYPSGELSFVELVVLIDVEEDVNDAPRKKVTST